MTLSLPSFTRFRMRTLSLLQRSELQNLTSLDAEYRFRAAPNPMVAWLSVTISIPEPMPCS